MSDAIIRQLYESRLQVAVAARGDLFPNEKSIQFENEDFDPPNNARGEDNVYLRAFLLPAEKTTSYGGDITTFRGVFQVSVVLPKNVGNALAKTITDWLDELFPVNLVLSEGVVSVQSMTPLVAGPGIPSDTAYTVPTSFAYRADVV